MPGDVEKEGRWLTWKAWLRRNEDRLFDPGDPVLLTKEDWDRADNMYWGLAVGVMPSLEVDSSSDIIVGEWRGFQPGLGGMTLVIRTIGHFGSTTHRSPLNVGFIHVLPPIYQKLVAADWNRNEESHEFESCPSCTYTFRPGEEPCTCEHDNAYGLCGWCCLRHTEREEKGYDNMVKQMVGER